MPLKDSELMQLAGEWISDSISAHYEFGGDAPGENDGKRLCGELYERAEKARLMGNGEGHTVLILTDAESRLVRAAVAAYCAYSDDTVPLHAFNQGIQRGTARIKAEFDDEQRKRKEAKR